MRPKIIEIATFVRKPDGSFDLLFEADSNAKSVIFKMEGEGKVQFTNPRGLYQASRKIVEVQIRG
jgi:hypothetical protein